MCDYSLMCVPNRLARENEKLVSHRFETGTMGLAAQSDLHAAKEARPARRKSFWVSLKEFFAPDEWESVPAVCVPPGARLLLTDIADDFKNEIGVGRVEEVTFTQITAAANSYRDAFRFRNGREVLLQRIREGQRVQVLSLAPEAEPALDTSIPEEQPR